VSPLDDVIAVAVDAVRTLIGSAASDR